MLTETELKSLTDLFGCTIQLGQLVYKDLPLGKPDWIDYEDTLTSIKKYINEVKLRRYLEEHSSQYNYINPGSTGLNDYISTIQWSDGGASTSFTWNSTSLDTTGGTILNLEKGERVYIK